MLSYLHINHGFFNRPIDHQSTSNDRLKPVMTTGLVNMHIDRSIANLDLQASKVTVGKQNLLCYFSIKAYVVGAQKNSH